MVAEPLVALFSFVLLWRLLWLRVVRVFGVVNRLRMLQQELLRDTHDASRVGCGTATKNVNEAPIVLWSRRRLGHSGDDDTSVLWSVGSKVVHRDGNSSTRG